jgi:hypothetical protein
MMKKYLLLLTYVITFSFFTNNLACPCEFSSDDARPFFEQYENENKAITSQPTDKKENKS